MEASPNPAPPATIEESAPAEFQTPAQPAVHAPGGAACWRLSAGAAVFFLLIDQATKILAQTHLKPESAYGPQPTIPIIPGLFQLRYAENTGAAFSMLTGNTVLLTFISVGAAVVMTYWWTRLPAREMWGRLGLALIVSGAVGNLFDRALRGYVVDFFDAYWRTHHFPVFNVADSIICTGVGLLVLRMMQGKI
ncbi:signal peptidase II [Candidatus Poribacteria bacterium]|nr:signal peptidase II [Candidatus Poribacteria bacterium]